VPDGRPIEGPARRYSPMSGDTIELQRADARRGLGAGDRGRVLVQTDEGGIRVRFGAGAEAQEHVFGPTQFEQLKVVHELELRVGDPVLHGRNDAARGLKNGMRGIIQSRTPEGGAVVVYPSRTVTYSKRGLNDLALAYATTVHKAQGQENRVAILGAHHAEHRVLLDKALLYVGLTRATEMAFCVGTPAALRICLREAHGQARHTRLADRTAALVALQQALPPVSAPARGR
jgi:ATP-dependent exoDNAse (exonuclease V) alpha subunit